MLVLVSFVLVLAAAVTLVVGLLQSGLTLIYLSIGCSVLAGVVLAVAVLRGRPEARPATAGRAFSPPQRAEVPAAVGASSATQTTTSWSSPPAATTPAPPPPSPPPARVGGDDAATKAAGSALLGRLRGRKAEEDAGVAPTVVPPPPVAEPVAADSDRTTEIPVTPGMEDEDGFPIGGYDRLRATELLALLPGLDRNQLEAVRQRESAGKNRFTIMSRIDSLLASKAEPAWEVADDSWESDTEADTDAAADAAMADEDEAALDADLAMDTAGDWDDDEVDELVSPSAGSGFPIAGYETLTVGQILPRLSELGADDLAAVRSREQQGRNRGTILDRVDRLSARAGARSGSGAMAMPAASAPTRKAPTRKAAGPVSKTTAPAVKKARTPRASKAAAIPVAPVPEPVKAPPSKATTRRAAARKAPAAAAIPVPPAPAPARAKKATAPKVAGRKVPAPAAPSPMKDAVKKAKATKATKRP